jgi:GR25 family glycosyltransferase involved in LPS biosynthesis
MYDYYIMYSCIVLVILIILLFFLIYNFKKRQKYHIYSGIDIDYDENFDWDNTQIYYINLDRAPKRKDNIEKILKRNNLEAVRIHGVDGQEIDITEEKYKKYFEKDKSTYDHYLEDNKHKGHFGCFLSQMKCYQEFLKTDKEYCIIFEDDMEIKGDNFKELVEKHYKNVPYDWEVLLFGYNLNDNYHTDRSKGIQMVNNIINIHSFTGLHGYMINRQSAKKLLKELENHRWYIDWNMVYMIDDNNLKVYGVYPPFVCQPAAHAIDIKELGLFHETSCKQEMGGMFGSLSEAFSD